ncbi:helix-turn-helix transcriptional regulator [Caldibacillus thermoamylovorans]
MDEQQSKTTRVLSMYDRLRKGETIKKKVEAERFGVNEKTIQRDIEDLRTYLADTFYDSTITIEYDRQKQGYVLTKNKDQGLTNEEILVIAKILLESRSLKKHEMEEILDKLIFQLSPQTQNITKSIIANERHYYASLQHNRPLIQTIWHLSEAVHKKKLTTIHYQKEGTDAPVVRTVRPVGIMFAEYYFYLTAFPVEYNFDFPTIYRIDRIVHYEVTENHFKVDYVNRFQEGEFRKRVQFMHAGELMRIAFRFWGPSLQAVLDRLPTAKVIGTDGQASIIEAEVYGRGIKMWLLSQAQYLEVLQPAEFREEMKRTIESMLNNYIRD